MRKGQCKGNFTQMRKASIDGFAQSFRLEGNSRRPGGNARESLRFVLFLRKRARISSRLLDKLERYVKMVVEILSLRCRRGRRNRLIFYLGEDRT